MLLKKFTVKTKLRKFINKSTVLNHNYVEKVVRKHDELG